MKAKSSIENPHVLVIAGYPGIGKTFFKASVATEDSKRVLDSDSSLFHWNYINGKKVTRYPNPDFIDDYVGYIRYQIQQLESYEYNMCDYPVKGILLVSTHHQVLNELAKSNINVTLVYPQASLKSLYLSAYKRRGDNEAFLSTMATNWDNMQSDVKKATLPKVELGLNEHLYDSLDKVLKVAYPTLTVLGGGDYAKNL